MHSRCQNLLLSMASGIIGSLLVFTSSSAEEVKLSGTVCWTGEIETISTGEKNIAWSWKIDWVWTSDDDDLEKTQFGNCYGIGAMVEGQPNIPNHFCLHTGKDGSKHMSVGQPQADMSQTSTLFGGTGQFAGMKGGFVGAPEVRLPAADGRVAGCRHTSGTYTTSQ